MRRAIIVLGFSLIVFMVIAGCTSPQSGPTTGPNSQNPASGNIPVKTMNVPSGGLPSGCWEKISDPTRFQKFLPDVPGWTPVGNPKFVTGQYSQISKAYQNHDSPAEHLGIVIDDKGACIVESTGAIAYVNGGYKKDYHAGETVTRIENYHGYPAIKRYSNEQGTSSEDVYIGISNRLSVAISAKTAEKGKESEVNADIDKFANSIDFKGLAASE